MQFDSIQHAKYCIENAKRVLAAPEVIYQNGNSSHEAHGQILEQAEDYLLECGVAA
jgi:hypothetical protein